MFGHSPSETFSVPDAFATQVLPFRNKPHRYNCSVDSLSSRKLTEWVCDWSSSVHSASASLERGPEIFIVQHPGSGYPFPEVTQCFDFLAGSALPAYLITFA